MRFLKTLLVSALAAVAAAHVEPDYTKNPEGNSIAKPGLDEVVPAGKPYTITWKPTTKGPVSLVLLRGPSTNVQPIATIAEKIENTGEYEWTPSTGLEPDVTHYGLLIVVENTRQYQWSTQFGISNKDFAEGSDHATKPTPRSTSTDIISKEKTTALQETSSAPPVPTTTTTSTTSTSSTTTSSSIIITSSVARPPKSTSAPTTLHSASAPTAAPSASSTEAAPPLFTNGADRNAISFGGLALGVAAILAI
ncbi:Ser-Thr-rich glycosyl-phosphatidyl-inositol-anchored membrane family-domain-containing protein [Aspergillus taichungensis]|uniref:Ser-Thr-rich glycosyl-phosphatidyl-inositol-anchored membrane family-domain-containing protein n=1 Tax=Aspergillus taichungensis TaxID=482145 RepID=A0A2J5I3H7_9EURO|nr:Ser-Thr-rich glycosyl-phosphatidyl-inositol-anchored membrane family-domain-containing protein [Aspergillus taichungensis]